MRTRTLARERPPGRPHDRGAQDVRRTGTRARRTTADRTTALRHGGGRASAGRSAVRRTEPGRQRRRGGDPPDALRPTARARAGECRAVDRTTACGLHTAGRHASARPPAAQPNRPARQPLRGRRPTRRKPTPPRPCGTAAGGQVPGRRPHDGSGADLSRSRPEAPRTAAGPTAACGFCAAGRHASAGPAAVQPKGPGHQPLRGRRPAPRWPYAARSHGGRMRRGPAVRVRSAGWVAGVRPRAKCGETFFSPFPNPLSNLPHCP